MKHLVIPGLIVLLVSGFVLTGCGPTASPAVEATSTGAVTLEPSWTATLPPSATPVPSATATEGPTPTRRPTRTPFVTNTPLPTTEARLRDLANARGIDIGAAVAMDPLLNEEIYRQVLAREFSIVVAENVMKYDSLEPQRGVYDFSQSDQLVNFALEHGMSVRGHTLVWNQQNPDWLTGGKFTREELIKIMEDHITAVMTHYKGKVVAWDVVNEAIHDTDSPWLLGIGPEYVEIAYRAARKADPDALLFLNEYDGEGMNDTSDVVYEMAKDLKAKGLIDGVGLQMHIISNGGPARADIEANMRRLGELGLVVHITELDVRLLTPPTQRQLEDQANDYRQIFEACLSVSACKAVLMWGFTDKHSWVPYFFNGYGDALIFDANYAPKPAYHMIRQLLSQ